MPVFLIPLLTWIGSALMSVLTFIITKLSSKAISMAAYVASFTALVAALFVGFNNFLSVVVTSAPSEVTQLLGHFMPANFYTVFSAAAAFNVVLIIFKLGRKALDIFLT